MVFDHCSIQSANRIRPPAGSTQDPRALSTSTSEMKRCASRFVENVRERYRLSGVRYLASQPLPSRGRLTDAIVEVPLRPPDRGVA